MNNQDVQQFVIAGFMSVARSPRATVSERLKALDSLSKVYGLYLDLNQAIACLHKHGLTLDPVDADTVMSQNDRQAADRAVEQFFSLTDSDTV